MNDIKKHAHTLTTASEYAYLRLRKQFLSKVFGEHAANSNGSSSPPTPFPQSLLAGPAVLWCSCQARPSPVPSKVVAHDEYDGQGARELDHGRGEVHILHLPAGVCGVGVGVERRQREAWQSQCNITTSHPAYQLPSPNCLVCMETAEGEGETQQRRRVRHDTKCWVTLQQPLASSGSLRKCLTQML